MIKLTYDKVKTFIESVDGYSLVSTEYVNNSTKLKIKCPEHHIFEMTLHNFKDGYKERCPECSGNKKRILDDIKQIIESEHGYELLSTKYINARTKLKIKCPNSHTFQISYNTWSNTGNRCSYCAGNTKLTQRYVENVFSDEKYMFNDIYT